MFALFHLKYHSFNDIIGILVWFIVCCCKINIFWDPNIWVVVLYPRQLDKSPWYLVIGLLLYNSTHPQYCCISDLCISYSRHSHPLQINNTLPAATPLSTVRVPPGTTTVSTFILPPMGSYISRHRPTIIPF